jgi:hypothetical protein
MPMRVNYVARLSFLSTGSVKILEAKNKARTKVQNGPRDAMRGT